MESLRNCPPEVLCSIPGGTASVRLWRGRDEPQVLSANTIFCLFTCVLIVGSDGLRLGSYFSLQRGTAAVTLSGQNTSEEDQDPHSGRGDGGRGLPDR